MEGREGGVLINNIKKSGRVSIIFFKDNYKKILKHLFYVILMFCFSVLLTVWFPESSESIGSIFAWIISAYISVIYFRLLPDFLSRQEIRSLENRLKKENNISLYEWLGNLSVHDITLYSWLKAPQKGDIIINLRAVKEHISSNIGKEISDYYLIKKYLLYHGENNFMNSIWKSIVPIILASFGGLLLKLGFLDRLYSYFTKTGGKSDFFEIIDNIIRIGVFALFFILILMFVRYEFTKEKRRIDLLTSIVDTIIEEKSEKK